MASAISQSSKSAAIRAQLKYPVIDSDGHTFEMGLVFFDYLKRVAGATMVDRYRRAFDSGHTSSHWRENSPAQRRERRELRPTWRGIAAANTRDLATAILPRLTYERLDEMGLDHAVIYPTLGFQIEGVADDEVRQAAVRAHNLMKAEMFAEFSDRLTPVAGIPMYTPQEAIEELEYAVKELKFKAVMVPSYVKRPIAAVEKRYPGVGQWAYWMDTYGLDSEYDYDPFWAKCVELGVSPTFHSLGYGWGARQSVTNYVHNHLGNFGASADAICRGLLMGGVPKRFPKLTFAFLEGGMAWARALYSDAISHWQKRNGEAIALYDPDRIDRALLKREMVRAGGRFTQGHEDQILDALISRMYIGEDAALTDEWAPSGITSPQQLRDIFVNQFYFGCEGDDPLNALAFRPMGTPFEARLKALYGSDIGHWDVPDMSEVLEEAYELVEHHLIDEDELRQFLFDNAVAFWTSTNRDFFKGTTIESEVEAWLSARK
ncbi:MAG TPA: amidohydrolase family protein [Candidatus Binataceae bacterium]|nr:amidohydrolase family protein [Candidatus Binataceae bacterium]